MNSSQWLFDVFIKLVFLVAAIAVLVIGSTVQATELQVINTMEGMAAEGDGKPRLELQLYVIFTTPINGREVELVPVDGKLPDVLIKHLAFQHELEASGVMFAAGPLYNQDRTWSGEGMVIIRATSFEQATRIAEADPIHAAGVRGYTIRPWHLAEGGFSMEITFSDLGYNLK